MPARTSARRRADRAARRRHTRGRSPRCACGSARRTCAPVCSSGPGPLYIQTPLCAHPRTHGSACCTRVPRRAAQSIAAPKWATRTGSEASTAGDHAAPGGGEVDALRRGQVLGAVVSPERVQPLRDNVESLTAVARERERTVTDSRRRRPRRYLQTLLRAGRRHLVEKLEREARARGAHGRQRDPRVPPSGRTARRCRGRASRRSHPAAYSTPSTT